MQMSLRTRILDLLPVLVIFAIVAAFATFVVVEFVVREPVTIPAPATTPIDIVDPSSVDREAPR
jgi:hypothetical protein